MSWFSGPSKVDPYDPDRNSRGDYDNESSSKVAPTEERDNRPSGGSTSKINQDTDPSYRI